MLSESAIKKINILILLVSLLVMITIEIPSVQTQEGNTIYVDDDGGADYTSIQEAIDAANPGDTVYVYSGIYYEHIVIDKSINLVGAAGGTTVIDGEYSGTVVHLTPSSSYVNITGFTIQNSGYEMYDEGVNIDSDFNRIIDNSITNSTCGLSLDFWAHNCLIQENLFMGNVKGVSVYSVYPNNNTFFLNDFRMNTLHAFDNSNSTWDYLGEGNYWDDFDEPSEGAYDNNGDGIVDTPYEIYGNSAQDNYPLMEPYNTPGFEVLVMILAIGAVVFILKNKKKKN